MKKSIFAAIFLISMTTGCMEGAEECQVSPQEDGGSLIDCPGESTVTTDEEVPEDARCQVREKAISCSSGQRFEIPEDADNGEDAGDGEDAGNGEEPDVADGTDGAEEPAANGYADPMSGWESSCRVVGDTVMCQDGATLASEEVDEGASCRARTVPGVGRRIVCDDVEHRPDANSVDGIDVECRVDDLEDESSVISCSDGTGVVAENLEEDCEPDISRDGRDVTVTCGAFGETLEVQERCEGTFRLETTEEIEEFEELRCTAIWGDVIVEDTPLYYMEALEDVAYVSGSVRIIGNELLRKLGRINLHTVGGDFEIRGNESLEVIDYVSIFVVRGSVIYTQNPAVEVIESRHGMAFIHGAWIIAGHDELRMTGWYDDDDRIWRWELPEQVHIRNSFVFIDNPKFGYCRARDMWAWGLSMADTVYLGNNASRVQETCL